MARLKFLLTFAVLSFGSPAFASDSLSDFPDKVLPVLVAVDAHGKVRSVSPADPLSPAMDRLLRQNLQEMISAPVNVKGRPTSSQFVASMSLSVASAAEGQYSVQFVPVAVSPVPLGNWYWVRTDGRHLALAQQGSGLDHRRRIRIEPPQPRHDAPPRDRTRQDSAEPASSRKQP